LAINKKLIAHHRVAVHTRAAAGAMHLAMKAGFDPHCVAEVIRHGAGASVMFNIRAPLMAARQFKPAMGAFQTMDKYIELAASLADQVDCTTPLLDATAPYFKRALASGMAEEDIAAVIKLLEDETTASGHHTSKKHSS
jgi:3-hydroxyisobutyrate dehydrogenase